jgi:nucleotide-binding universal stress UspA family protein
MRVLIAYDGSPCADTALSDLERAGLPAKAEALVYSVAELWLPATHDAEQAERTFPTWFAPEVGIARALADAAGERLRALFPEWTVEVEVAVGSACDRLLGAIASWTPDLVVVGARGRTGVEALTLGSISQIVSAEAPCPVRIARRTWGRGTRPRVAVCVDGSASGWAALDAVTAREWSPEPEILLVTGYGPFGASTTASRAAAESVRAVHLDARERLRASGLDATSAVREGDPRRVLVEEAERWSAETIFVGTRDLSRRGRSLLDSVSAAIVMRAHCTVEVVHSGAGA